MPTTATTSTTDAAKAKEEAKKKEEEAAKKKEEEEKKKEAEADSGPIGGELEAYGDGRLQAYFRVIMLSGSTPPKKEEEKKEEDDKKDDDKKDESKTTSTSTSTSKTTTTTTSSSTASPKTLNGDNLTFSSSVNTTYALVSSTAGSGANVFGSSTGDNSLKVVTSKNLFDLKFKNEFGTMSDPGKVMVFDQRRGEILGRPYITLSTRCHNYAEFIINDPQGKIYEQIKDFQKVEIEIGFTNGRRFKKYSGVVSWIGRKLPVGTLVRSMDLGATLKNVQQPGATNNNDSAVDADKLKNADLGIMFDANKDLGDIVEENLLKSFPMTTVLFDNLYNLQKQEKNKGSFTVNETTLEQLLPVISSGRYNIQNATPAEKKQMVKSLLKGLSEINALGKNQPAVLEKFNDILEGKIKDKSKVTTDKKGEVQFELDAMAAAIKQASSQGEVITTDGEGNTTKNTPGEGKNSGVTMDYNELRDVFKYQPRIIKRSALNNRSGFTSVSIQGWDSRDKSTRGATVAASASNDQIIGPDGGVISVPAWGEVKISDPLFEGCVYTWGDATKNGTRVPSAEIMHKIVSISVILQKFTDETVGKGKKWTITSWYRDQKANQECGGAKYSQHLSGNAVDANFPGFIEWHKKMKPSYQGGLAIKYPSPGNAGFVHIDNRGSVARWVY